MWQRSRWILFLTICLLPGLLTFGLSRQPASAAPALTTAGVAALHSGPDGLSFHFRTPELALPLPDELRVPGLTAVITQPGAPALPYYSTLVALPPAATTAIEVRVADPIAYAAPALQPVPQVADREGLAAALDARAVTQLEDFGLASLPDPAVYDGQALYPAAWYSLSAPMMLRDLRVVRLVLYPLRYDPVSDQVLATPDMSVTLRFEGASTTATATTPFLSADTYARLLLNPEQAQAWHYRSPTLQSQDAALTLPVGADAYKINIDQDGIYQISYADLQAAGMDVANINPHTFAMMSGGQSVSYYLVDDGDAVFEPGEMILFYGWKFDGSRLDRQYIQHNVFWLWANGTPSLISTVNNPTGFPAKTAFRSSLSTEQDLVFSSTYTAAWDSFPNEPDAFYWVRLDKYGVPSVSATLPITLPHPTPGATDANLTVEVLSRGWYSHSAVMSMNGSSYLGTWSNYGYVNANIQGAVPQTTLIPGANQVTVTLNSPGDGTLYVNRITVDYWRDLIADGDELIFTAPEAGTDEFQLSGYSVGSPSNLLALNISQPHQPTRIPINGADISGGGPYTLRLASEHAADARFIVTTWANLRQPVGISRYQVADLDPPSDAVDWLAIAHPTLLSEAQRLANYRTAQDGLRTWVVNVDDVINQYGYGLPIPQALQNYIRHGVLDWAAGPVYVTLMGDATNDPRGLTCATCPIEQFVPTNLTFVDRWQGLIPSDHIYALVVGDDDLPDVAVGRLPAQTVAQAASMVDKIMAYEANLNSQASFMSNVIVLADNPEPGDDFCLQSLETLASLPPSFHIEQMCLETPQGRIALRNRLLAYLAQPGAAILNYRGHGSISYWAHNLMTAADDAVWQNAGRPTVILSADCLDGYFAWPGTAYLGLSEQFLKIAGGRGSAAHWSSTGLGYSIEHNVLHGAFYDALFDLHVATMGLANVYAKWVYLTGGYYASEGYAFTLQGDPALHLTPTANSCSAPVTPTASLTVQGNDLVLNWTSDPVNVTYEVWRGRNPAFPPDDPTTSVVRLSSQTTSFTEPNALGDVATNHFLAVRGVNACGTASAFSSRLGEVELALEPQRWHFVGWSLAVPGVDSADTLAAAVTHLNSVQQWNPGLQAWDSRNIKKGTGPDFPVSLGSAVRLKTDTAPPATYALIGAAPEPGALHFNLTPGWNSIVVPWEQTGLTTADALGATVPHATRVRQWNYALQKFEVRTIGVKGPNFPVAVGQAYQVYVTQSGVWP